MEADQKGIAFPSCLWNALDLPAVAGGCCGKEGVATFLLLLPQSQPVQVVEFSVINEKKFKKKEMEKGAVEFNTKYFFKKSTLMQYNTWSLKGKI